MLSNKSFGNAALTGISGGATTYSLSAIPFEISGKAYTKALVSGGATPTTDAKTSSAITLLANQGCVVVWALDTSGNVKCYSSAAQPLDTAGNFVVAPDFAGLPDTVAPFAYTVHKAGSTLSGTFTFGSTNWNTTGMTNTAVSVMELPARPQVS